MPLVPQSDADKILSSMNQKDSKDAAAKADLFNESEPTKKRRGRPPKEKVEATPQLDEMALVPVIAIYNSFMESRSPKWVASPDEMVMMSRGLMPVINKYAPALANWQVELAAIGCILAFVGPRLLMPEPEPKKEQKENGPKSVAMPESVY